MSDFRPFSSVLESRLGAAMALTVDDAAICAIRIRQVPGIDRQHDPVSH